MYDNPTLGEVRGKIVIMQNFSDPYSTKGYSSTYGITYPNDDKPTGEQVPDTGVQDWYALADNWDLYQKWIYVAEALNRAQTNSLTKRYLNFLSASTGSFPYFVASGHSSPGTSAPLLATGLTTLLDPNTYPDFPRTDCLGSICTISFEGTDILTMNFLNTYPLKRIGIIFSDFPDYGLINAIISVNKQVVDVVINNNDSGSGSLRNAISDGNPIVGFDPDLMSGLTITLTSGNIVLAWVEKLSGQGLTAPVRITASQPTRIGP